ncbi:TPA: MFS transporter [Klebsiella pneumoniae]|nr:MFS transporter [Klebsiella pneumoniae]HBR1941264.1 MFS transporter [Klebsiella pneumoniae]HBX5941017.1 MFS transporter [Klebsiella pneumoniae]
MLVTFISTSMRWLQLLAACLTGLLIPLCFTGPAVVLPAIRQELGGSSAQLSWIMNAYILSYGGAMMVSGSLTDIYGRMRIWLIGLLWFSAFTFTIPFAPSVLWIDILRLLQGMGGAAAFAAAMSSLASLFEGASRTRAFSLLGTTFGLGLSFGPLVSGWIVETNGWQGVFHATGVMGVLGLGMAAVSNRGARETVSGTLDWPGAISFTLALGLFTYGMLLVPENGWRDPFVVAILLASVAVFISFVVIERRVAQPMLDLQFFRDPSFLGVQALAASPAFFFIVLIVMLPGRFIGIDGYGALQAGQMMVWLAAPLLLMPFLAAMLARWFRPGHLSAAGLLLVSGGLFWLAHGFSHGGGIEIRPPLLLIGIGIGIPWGLMDAMAVSVVSLERVGMATGIFNTVRVSADGVAIAIVSALFATLIQKHMTLESVVIQQKSVLEASSLAALGEIQTAESLVPGLESLLSQSYATAFVSVLNGLGTLAAVMALVVLALLHRQTASYQRDHSDP